MMRILFLASASKPDYMCDMLYHGLKSSPKILVEELNVPYYMYNTYENKRTLYGMGFTLYARLPQQPTAISVWQMLSRVRRKYYDFVIYGSIKRYNSFFSFVSMYYDRTKLIVVDGEDETVILNKYVKPSTYYKRELDEEDINLQPINFAIPEELIVNTLPGKNKRTGFIIPGDLSTYIYKEEAPYYLDYQNSIFGVTMKKAGWDCLRHYEILMNGCIPYFKDMQHCPQRTMEQFPKKEIEYLNEIFESQQAFDHKPHLENLLHHTRTKLTTLQLAKRIVGL